MIEKISGWTHKNFGVIKIFFLLIVFALLLGFLISNLNVTIDTLAKIKIIPLLVSLIVLPLFPIGNTIIWAYITRLNRIEMPFRKLLVLKIYSDLGKYLPGRLWGYGFLMSYYSKDGKSNTFVAYSAFLEQALSTLSICIILVSSILFLPAEEFNEITYLSCVLLIILLFVITPKIFEYLANKMLGWIGRNRIKVTLNYLQLLKITMFYIINWFFFALAFMFFLTSFGIDVKSNLPYLIVSISFSSIAGLIAVFAPGGIGVREGALAFTLNRIMALEIASTIAISSRIWVTVSELVILLIVFIYDKSKKILD